MLSRNILSRRGFLSGTAALIYGGAKAKSDPTELTELSAVEAVARMRRGDLRAEDYAKALLERCMSAKSLNAFITLEPEQVLRDARAADQLRARRGAVLGPLHGLPIPVKDSVNTRDYPTTGGTPALRHFRPAVDAPLVTQLRAAGAIVMGKTNLHELSYGWTSNNHAFGAVHNPGKHGGRAGVGHAGWAYLERTACCSRVGWSGEIRPLVARYRDGPRAPARQRAPTAREHCLAADAGRGNKRFQGHEADLQKPHFKPPSIASRSPTIHGRGGLDRLEPGSVCR